MHKKISHVFHCDLLRWYHRYRRDLPWRRCITPYRVAVAELMCQQTQITTVLPYYERWMQRWHDWKSLAQARGADVLKMWEGLGYYRRARSLHAMAQEVMEKYNGELPDDIHKLQKLPGIGAYTAGAIASIAFGKRVPLVDGNVERVFSRAIGVSPARARNRARAGLTPMWALAQQLLPKKNCGDFNQALMECGSQICTPRNPQCSICPLKKICRALLSGKNPEFISLKSRPKTIAERETLAWIQKNKKLWLESPKNSRRWKGFYRLPHWDAQKMSRGKKLFDLTYTITRYRVRADVIQARAKNSLQHGKWFSFQEIEKIFLPAPHRKITRHIRMTQSE